MASARALTDHDDIRRWAERRKGRPACVRGTGGRGDTGMIRLDFPGFSGGKSQQPISWDEWFRSFDSNKLALLVQDRRARGQQSNFNKLVVRAASPRSRGAAKRASTPRREARAGRGRTRQTATSASGTRRRSSSAQIRHSADERNGRNGKTQKRSRSASGTTRRRKKSQR
jgi:hypothetical protein